MIFRVSLVQDVSHLDPVVSWLIGTSCFHFVLAKRKRHRRRAKAWKEKECYASLPRASPVSITLLPNGRGTGDARRHGRKRSPTRLFLARLLFPFPFSQAEKAQETCEGVEGKEIHLLGLLYCVLVFFVLFSLKSVIVC